MFLRNCWYVAAWATEITDNILGRTLLNVPVAIYRTANGEVAAVLDACPHKFAPLSMGRRIGDVIQHDHLFRRHQDGNIPGFVELPANPAAECGNGCSGDRHRATDSAASL